MRWTRPGTIHGSILAARAERMQEESVGQVSTLGVVRRHSFAVSSSGGHSSLCTWRRGSYNQIGAQGGYRGREAGRLPATLQPQGEAHGTAEQVLKRGTRTYFDQQPAGARGRTESARIRN